MLNEFAHPWQSAFCDRSREPRVLRQGDGPAFTSALKC
jgi:hypothetical protein